MLSIDVRSNLESPWIMLSRLQAGIRLGSACPSWNEHGFRLSTLIQAVQAETEKMSNLIHAVQAGTRLELNRVGSRERMGKWL